MLGWGVGRDSFVGTMATMGSSSGMAAVREYPRVFGDNPCCRMSTIPEPALAMVVNANQSVGTTVRQTGLMYALLLSGNVAVMVPLYMLRMMTLAPAIAMR